MVEQVEISSFDLRYEGYRLKNPKEEKSLLTSILENGIREPLQGVNSDSDSDSPSHRILLDGFKRYRERSANGVICLSPKYKFFVKTLPIQEKMNIINFLPRCMLKRIHKYDMMCYGCCK